MNHTARFDSRREAFEFIEDMENEGVEAHLVTPGPRHSYLVDYYETSNGSPGSGTSREFKNNQAIVSQYG